MGDSDCASYHQHVPNTIQQQFHHHQQHHHQQQQQRHHEQHHQNQQHQHVGQIAPNLNQLSPLQFGSTTGSATYLSQNVVDTHSTVTTTTATNTTSSSPSSIQNVATSSLVTANLQQLSVSSNNLSHCIDTPLKSLADLNNHRLHHNHQINQQQQQQLQQQEQHTHPLASAAAALHQYLGQTRQRSESCANFTTVSENTKNVENTNANNNSNVRNNININIKNHLGSITLSQQSQQQQQHQQLPTQLSKDHLESEDEVALQPLSNQVSCMENFLSYFLRKRKRGIWAIGLTIVYSLDYRL